MKVAEKLAPQAPMQTSFAIGKNLKTGELYAEEYGKHTQLKGQMSMEDVEDVPVDPSTGEVLAEAKPAVLDLRKAAVN